MSKEFNLSETIHDRKDWYPNIPNEVICIGDVKEFIRLLKEEIKRASVCCDKQRLQIIDNLAGEKLI